ncbi:MAG: MBOAT family protein, partial [Acidobacteria bacterium]|nr:MBOAT family protein [Acidobacteriota bacterium]
TLLAGVLIALNLGALAYFKYLGFIAETLSPWVPSLSAFTSSAAVAGAVAIPPGISFYSFQQVGYAVDTLRSGSRERASLTDFMNFAAFFPQLVAGPIERRADLLPQMQQFKFAIRADHLDSGIAVVVFGMFLKFVLADNIAPFVNLADVSSAFAILLSVFLFGLKIYFDFAGYSFVAVGLARILGVRLTFNFLAPYAAKNVQDFWRRWHVTLSRWFRDYLYLALGGSRVKWVSLNVLFVFTVSGLWHGAGWNYVLWGAYHGVLLMIFRHTRGWSLVRRIPDSVAWAATFGAAMFGWLFFMETRSDRLWQKLEVLVSPGAYDLTSVGATLSKLGLAEGAMLGVVMALSAGVLVLEHVAVWREHDETHEYFIKPVVARVLLVAIFLMSARTATEFVYFAF